MSIKPKRVDETERKIEIVAEWIRTESAHRKHHKAWGEVTIRLVWENGEVKLVKFLEETLMRDLPQPSSGKSELTGD